MQGIITKWEYEKSLRAAEVSLGNKNSLCKGQGKHNIRISDLALIIAGIKDPVYKECCLQKEERGEDGGRKGRQETFQLVKKGKICPINKLF